MKHILSVVIAASIALTPAFVSAQEYRFRYRTDFVSSPVNPPEEYGQGNDIQAYFSTVVGEDFSRRIPVATRDVVSWQRVDGTLPTGISLLDEQGVVKGFAHDQGQTEGLWHGFDSNGNKIARAQIFFSVHKPEGVELNATYYGHTDQYFYTLLPNPAGIQISHWTALTDPIPGMDTRYGALDGAPTSEGLYDIILQGHDYMDRKVAYMRATLLVEDGPTLARIPDQYAEKANGEVFDIVPTVAHQIGAISYKLVPVTSRPVGLTFSSSNGHVGGVFNDHSTSASFQIEARDSADGTTGRSNTFTLTTGPDAISMNGLELLTGYINQKQEWKLSASTGGNLKLNFAVTQGSLPEGLLLDSDTGIISGIPTKIEEQANIVITASASGVAASQAGPFVFRILADKLLAETTVLNTRVETAFRTEPLKVTSGIAAPMTYTSEPGISGVEFNSDELTFSSAGISQPGQYLPSILVANGAEDSIHVQQVINVHALPEMVYGDLVVKRKEFLSASPVIPEFSIVGTPSFKLKQGKLPSWVRFDSKSGRLYGTPFEVTDITPEPLGPFVVSVLDELGVPYDSEPFTLKVDDRDPVEMVPNHFEIERYVTNGFKPAYAKNAYGEVAYRLEDSQSVLPSTLSINPWGYLTGSTSAPVGTVFSGLTLHAVDEEGYSGKYGPFSLTVVEPKNPPPLDGSFDKAFTWVEDQDFKGFALPRMANPYGAVTYKLNADAPDGLSVVNGELVGRIDAPSPNAVPITFTYVVTDDLGRSATGTISLLIQEAMTLTASDVYVLNRGTNTPFAPERKNGLGPFTYTLDESYELPKNLAFDGGNGQIYGVPNEEGVYPVRMSVRDKTGDRASTEVFSIRVEAPLPLTLEYRQKTATRGDWSMIYPTVVGHTGELEWTHISGELPPGLSFVPSGPDAGRFVGVPTQTGVWRDIRVGLKDKATAQSLASPYLFDITVVPNGILMFDPVTLKHRASTVSTPLQLNAHNGLGKIRYEFAPGSKTYSDNMLLSSDGTLSVAFGEPGVYDGILVKATDEVGRTATTQVSLEIIGQPAITVAAAHTMKEFVEGHVPFVLDNVIGTPTVILSGSDALSWLSISGNKMLGIPSKAGDFSDLRLRVVDSYDQAAANSELFEITVEQRDALSAPVDALLSGKQYQVVAADIPFEHAIGNVSFTSSPALPSEITATIGSSNLHLEGVFDEPYSGTFTLTFKDEKGAERGTSTTTLTVNVDERDQLTIQSPEYVIGKQFTPIATKIVTISNNVGPVTLTVTPDLPSELSLSEDGLLSGVPLQRLPETVYTIFATDGKGGGLGEASAQIKLSVNSRDQLTLKMGEPVVGKQYSTLSAQIFDVTNAAGPVEVAITPPLPTGLIVSSDGILSGTPVGVQTDTTYSVLVTDHIGGSLGNASGAFSLAIEARDPLKIVSPDEFTFNLFSEATFTLTQENAINGYTFSADTELPSWLTLDGETGVIVGKPTTRFADQRLTFRVVDGVGDFKIHEVLVKFADRLAPVISAGSDQTALLNYDYMKQLETENVFGTPTWSLISGTLPDGIEFDATMGAFVGKPTEFGIFDNIVIGLTDTYEGVTVAAMQKAFRITVSQDGSPISLIGGDAVIRLGHNAVVDAPAIQNSVGNVIVVVDGLTGSGLAYDATRRQILGTPSKLGIVTAIFSVSDSTGRNATLAVDLDVRPKLSVVISAEQNAIFNYSLTDVGFQQPVGANIFGSATWSIDHPENLPKGISFNSATGEFIGSPQAIGSFGPVRITLADALPGTTTSDPFYMVVFMNEDPITLSVSNIMGKVGYTFSTAVPTYGNTLSGVRFYSLDLAGTNLEVDPKTGVITGSFDDPQDRNVNLSVTDETFRVTSRPVRLQIVPKMTLFAAASTRIAAQEPMTPIMVTRQNVVGEAQWHSVPAEDLPVGVAFNTQTGQFEGQAEEVGTYGPFHVESTDSLGDTGRSNAITLIVQPGALYVNLLRGSLEAATKRSSYTFDFRTLVDPQTVGVDISELTWSMSGNTPLGLTISPTTGILSGTPTRSGQYDFRVSVSYNGKTWGRDYSLIVRLPEASLELAQDVNSVTPTATRFVTGEDHFWSMDYKQFLTRKNIPEVDVRWSIENLAQGESLPEDLTLDDVTGIMSGTARSGAGTYTFRLTARYVDDVDEDYSVTETYSIKVRDTLSFTLAADEQPISAYKRAAFSYDFEQYVMHLPAEHISRLTFSYDAIPVAPTEAAFAGLSFAGSELQGTPVVSGIYDIVVTASVDEREATATYRMNVGLQQISLLLEDVILADGVPQEAYSFDFKSLATVKNVLKTDLRWSVSSDVVLQGEEIAGLPAGLDLDATTGMLTGTPTTGAKTYRFTVTAAWSDGNPDAENLTASHEYVLKTVNAYYFTKIEARGAFSCGLTNKGGVKCWGNNASLQLGAGLGAYNIALTPVDVLRLETGVVDISLGLSHACALTVNGAMFCWGSDANGQLGNGVLTTSNQNTPVTPGTFGVKDVKAIAAGANHTCAVNIYGAARCWGQNNYGQVGNTTGGTENPVAVTGLTSGVRSISAGDNHSCALMENGSVKCWGSNSQGQLGNNATATRVYVPVDVVGLTAKELSLGTNHSCALTTTSGVQCWGQNHLGQLGNGASTVSKVPVPVVDADSDIVSIATSRNSSCAVTTSGAIKCWGDNSLGVYGNGSVGGNSLSAVSAAVVPGGARNVSLATSHGCAVNKNGLGYCWGEAAYGKLGNNDQYNSVYTPVEVWRE